MMPIRNSISFHQPCGQKLSLGRVSMGKVSRVAAFFKWTPWKLLYAAHVREPGLSIGFR